MMIENHFENHFVKIYLLFIELTTEQMNEWVEKKTQNTVETQRFVFVRKYLFYETNKPIYNEIKIYKYVW